MIHSKSNCQFLSSLRYVLLVAFSNLLMDAYSEGCSVNDKNIIKNDIAQVTSILESTLYSINIDDIIIQNQLGNKRKGRMIGSWTPDKIEYYVTVNGVSSNDGMSWATATTLDAALASAVDDDVIHIGAGTYTPTVRITNGTSDFDLTFEIKNNIALIGGYPANPSEGDVVSTVNSTILNGTIVGGFKTYHVVAITAGVEVGKKILLESLTINNGQASGTASNVSINGLNYPINQGAAIIIGRSNVEINDCNISDNQSLGHTPGVYVFSAATVTFNKCLFQNNIGVGNAGALWNDGSTVNINNSNILANKVSGVSAGMQLIAYSKTNVYNTTIANNIAGMNGETGRSGAGVYVRNGSVATFVNCTVYGNQGSNFGGGICTNGTGGTTVNVISTTISNNKASNGGGGVYNSTDCTINTNNCIISGNTGKLVADNNFAGVEMIKMNSIVGDKVYNNTGLEVVGKSFNVATMLGALTDNGGNTKTCVLTGTNNPAETYGMSTNALLMLGNTFTPQIPENIVTYNQLSKLRMENIMGAWTKSDIMSELTQRQVPRILVYTDGYDIYIKSEVNDNISVSSITGQKLYLGNAKNRLTKIPNLIKGNIYIVNVNGQSEKIVI